MFLHTNERYKTYQTRFSFDHLGHAPGVGLGVPWGVSDFIWPFLRPYMGVILNPKMVFIFPMTCILALIFPIVIKYFPKCEGKGSFLKSQIKLLGVGGAKYFFYFRNSTDLVCELLT